MATKIEIMTKNYKHIPDLPSDTFEFENLEVLLGAGMPAKLQLPIYEAYAAFNLKFNPLFPEITSGDTQLTDEPTNAFAVWFCESEYTSLQHSDLELLDRFTRSNVDPERLEDALLKCVQAAKVAVLPYLNLKDPSAKTLGLLRNLLAYHIWANYPSTVEHENPKSHTEQSDDGSPVSLEQATTAFKESIDKFIEGYKEKNRQNPEQYPLHLAGNNAGLWNEFIFDFHVNGTV